MTAPILHPTAIIHDGAQIADTVEVGPYCVVGPNVSLAPGVRLTAHVSVEGRTTIGEGTIVHPFSVLGGPPQHTAYGGEDTKLIIGQNNIIREHVTMNIGTLGGRGETRIGNNGFFMTGAHIGHDCIVHDHVIFANCATLGGHVIVENNVFLGGLSAVHQFCEVGAYAFIGGCAGVIHDVIPFGSANGNYATLEGLNIIGMKRRNLQRSVINDLRAVYKHLFVSDGTFQERLQTIPPTLAARPEVRKITDFIHRDRKRPVMLHR